MECFKHVFKKKFGKKKQTKKNQKKQTHNTTKYRHSHEQNQIQKIFYSILKLQAINSIVVFALHSDNFRCFDKLFFVKNGIRYY